MSPNRLIIGLVLAVPALVTTHAAGTRPKFQMPMPCGQTWDVSTYATHSPDPDSIDMALRDESGTNLSEGQPVLASSAGIVHATSTASNGLHTVTLDHGGGWFTDYLHIEEEPPLAIGRQIAMGEPIARTSNSGTVAMHLHYTQRENSSARRIQFNGVKIATYEADQSSWGTWGTDSAEELTSLNCAGDTFMGWNQGGDRYYQLYKPGNGETKIIRLNANGAGVSTTWDSTWTRGWTHFMPYYQGGAAQAHAVIYKSATGQVNFMRMNLWGAGITTLATRSWWAGWTHFIPFDIGGANYFLAYDSIHGYANVDLINPQGDNSSTVYQGTWVKGRTLLVPFKMGPTQYLLLYKGGNGDVEVNKITSGGGTVSVTQVWSGSWSTGWTHLEPVSHDGDIYLIGYKAAGGSTKIMKVKANGQGVNTMATLDWTSPWTAFSPFTSGGDGYLLVYKAGTGEVKTLELKNGATGFNTIWQGSWTKGWS
jgi:Peptidase family M23